MDEPPRSCGPSIRFHTFIKQALVVLTLASVVLTAILSTFFIKGERIHISQVLIYPVSSEVESNDCAETGKNEKYGKDTVINNNASYPFCECRRIGTSSLSPYSGNSRHSDRFAEIPASKGKLISSNDMPMVSVSSPRTAAVKEIKASLDSTTRQYAGDYPLFSPDICLRC